MFLQQELLESSVLQSSINDKLNSLLEIYFGYVYLQGNANNIAVFRS